MPCYFCGGPANHSAFECADVGYVPEAKPMTPEQAKERAREWLDGHAERIGYYGYESRTGAQIAANLAALILSIDSEARREERKRCEEIVEQVRDIWHPRGTLPSDEGSVSGLACDEILRRLKEDE